jgi:hypothetical protein
MPDVKDRTKQCRENWKKSVESRKRKKCLMEIENAAALELSRITELIACWKQEIIMRNRTVENYTGFHPETEIVDCVRDTMINMVNILQDHFLDIGFEYICEQEGGYMLAFEKPQTFEEEENDSEALTQQQHLTTTDVAPDDNAFTKPAGWEMFTYGSNRSATHIRGVYSGNSRQTKVRNEQKTEKMRAQADEEKLTPITKYFNKIVPPPAVVLEDTDEEDDEAEPIFQMVVQMFLF